MTDEVQMLKLSFEFESQDEQADLERSAAAVRDTVSALPGVEDAKAEVSEARMIDPVTLGAIALTVKYVIKDSSDIVESLDQLVNQLKQLARDLGLPHLKVWLRREKVDANDLTAEKLQEFAAKAVPTKPDRR
jgi:hypothetical protein